MINKLNHLEAAEFSPEGGVIGARQSRLRWAVNGIMGAAIEGVAIGGNAAGRTIHGVVKGTWQLGRGLFNKPL